MPTFSGLLERVADDDESFLGEVVGGRDIIRLVVIDGVDVGQLDELGELQRLAALQLDLLDLLGVEQDIFALGDLIALEDLVAIDRSDARHHLFVARAGPRAHGPDERRSTCRSWSPDRFSPGSIPAPA